ncbi:MAG: glycosyltransferase family 2 protein [Lachnospiraceae bacterium]|nr:glycosyltransferase family 2 protein [Lachnospiraceae bacterium]
MGVNTENTTYKPALVSCIVTSYLREPEIVERALKSILIQDYPNKEILIVDDNRGPDSFKYSDGLKGLSGLSDNISVLRTEGGHGSQKARNTGIRHAKGKYVAFLDDDDEWLPGKLTKQIYLLEARPEIGMCYTDGYAVNNMYHPDRRLQIWKNTFHRELSYRELLEDDYIGTTSQAVIRVEAFEKCGLFDESLPARQDYEMWIRLSKNYPLAGIPEPLYIYYNNFGIKQISKNWRNCLKGHDAIYERYKDDIDGNRRAEFNIFFHKGHYYLQGFKKERVPAYFISAVCWYLKALFTSPPLMLKQARFKLRNFKRKYTGRKLLKKKQG